MGKRIFEEIKKFMGCFLEVIFPKPEVCSGCGRELKEESSIRLCTACSSKIVLHRDTGDNVVQNNSPMGLSVAYDNCIIACLYDGLAREMLHRIKYKDKREMALTIAAIMYRKIAGYELKYDFLVPVPLSKQKLKKRGYNHMKLIAGELSEYIKIPVLECLTRTKNTEPQVLFNGYDRWYNVKGCFKCNLDIKAKNILLVNDILTTGATAHFCAEELKKAGAKTVTVFSFAKSNLT